ncbi:hypothetical protein NKI15_06720 [Mesorhizobium sp. M0862]|uniref:hypothetical protein n=1 Tax=Mesorhizobium sp. M0862 TaxID=2957015 RepID=UPI003336B4C7
MTDPVLTRTLTVSSRLYRAALDAAHELTEELFINEKDADMDLTREQWEAMAPVDGGPSEILLELRAALAEEKARQA